jgi:hypothetical protein
MADLRKAKMQLGQAERKLLAIAVLYDASVAYFNWKKTLKNFKCIHSTTPMPKHVQSHSVFNSAREELLIVWKPV